MLEIPEREFLINVLKDKQPLFLTEELNWENLIKTIQKQGISPLFFNNLPRKKVSLPQFFEQKLKKIYWENVACCLVLHQELESLLKDLRTENIEVILLKGAALSYLVYPNFSLRPLTDLDFLIRKEDLKKVEILLKKLDYKLYYEEEKKFNHKFRGKQTYFKELKKDFPNTNLFLDLHWELESYFPLRKIIKLTPEEVFVRAKNFILNNEQAKTLGIEDLILYLCLHLSFHHNFSGLLWFYDLNLVINNYQDEIDWDILLKRAKSKKMEKILYLSFAFLNKIFATPFPEFVLKELKQKKFPYENIWEIILGEGNYLFPLTLLNPKERIYFILNYYFLPKKFYQLLVKNLKFLIKGRIYKKWN